MSHTPGAGLAHAFAQPKDARWPRLCAAAALAIGLGLGLSATPALAHGDDGGSGLLHMSDSDPAMQKAFQKAKATLPQFLQELAKPRDSTNHVLKIGLPHPGGTEYLWLGELKVKGDSFSGEIDNTPVYVKQKSGDRLSFKRSDVVDWMYVDAKGRLVGNFTACALMSKEPPAKAKAFAEQYGLDCNGF